MEFKVMMDGVEIGHSHLEHLDDGMGVAVGDFVPSAGYAGVKPLFRRLSDACDAGDVPAELWKARDSLRLQVVAPGGTQISAGSVMIYDFDIEGAWEVEVKLLDLEQWEHVSKERAG
jgi:hypothetical protein